ncbi:MAG: hypothetical protein IKV26_00540 [Paludibacteraceae bacterium]|nr:hypothetical protein [Paludibacteraceae bacterium]
MERYKSYESLDTLIQVRLNKLLKCNSNFKEYISNYVKFIPSGFNIDVTLDGGDETKIVLRFCIKHYGYEKMHAGLSVFDDLMDYHMPANAPEISPELRSATIKYIKEFEPEVWDVVSNKEELER